ncbi:hypothetical protein F383_27832 [Gossypium arboreum]|uniref:Uncharacterized protein n=1 Tax=Gossypium arboreum TaxID=29729 RepID=A0A0B0PFJ5_GOSAR|nr:hypothetical protein F383_27832 [Gossypium arboreum]
MILNTKKVKRLRKKSGESGYS